MEKCNRKYKFFLPLERCKHGTVRLNKHYYGIVYVCVGGIWHNICRRSHWTNADASVICKQLGFSPYGIRQCACFVQEHFNITLSSSNNRMTAIALNLILLAAYTNHNFEMKTVL